jgi:hypothetical protein
MTNTRKGNGNWQDCITGATQKSFDSVRGNEVGVYAKKTQR